MKRFFILACWFTLLALSAWQIRYATQISQDLTAFLPQQQDENTQLLLAQLQNGVASRVVLIRLQGADSTSLASHSRALVAQLSQDQGFVYVTNGDLSRSQAEQTWLFQHRYLLSPTVTAARFSAENLRQSLEQQLDLLSGSAGVIIKQQLPADPSAEFLSILSQFSHANLPNLQEGVWFNTQGNAALIMAQTRAAGFDAAGQEASLHALRHALQPIQQAGIQVDYSSTGAIAAQARQQIEQDSWKLSLLASVCAIALLLFVYRTPVVIILGLLPVFTGFLTGLAAVSLWFGAVHGITLGFAATIIGEAVDYPNYLFSHTRSGERLTDTAPRIWKTLRLAILTTVLGSVSLLFSSFSGLAQLGLLSMIGILMAGLSTRFVLPCCMPNYRFQESVVQQWNWAIWLDKLRALKPILVLAVIAALLVVIPHQNWWDEDIANLSPVSPQAKTLDQSLRAEIGAPDLRYLIAAKADSAEQALQWSEKLAVFLNAEQQRGRISAYELPSQILPSIATQQARQQSIPETSVLKQALQAANQDLPFKLSAFNTFFVDAAQQKNMSALRPVDVKNNAFALKLNSLLIQQGDKWIALGALKGVKQPAQLAQDLQHFDPTGTVRWLDLKNETQQWVNSFRWQSLWLTALGLVLIATVVCMGLQSWKIGVRIMASVLCGTLLTLAVLCLMEIKLSQFHLVALLLVVGIATNYALFFNREAEDALESRRTALSLVVCSLSTLAAFGALSLSSTPVLQAIGVTVGVGTIMSLLTSAVLARNLELE